jgi:hypothetical protein
LNPAFNTGINQAGNIGNGLPISNTFTGSVGQGLGQTLGGNDSPHAKRPNFNQPSATVLPGLGFGNRFDTPKYNHGINPTLKI